MNANNPARPVTDDFIFIGLTKREHIAVEICKAINSTEYSQTIPMDMIANMAVMQTDKLIAKLNENSDF